MLAFDLMESLNDYYERSYKFCQSLIEKYNRVGMYCWLSYYTTYIY